MVVTVRRDIYQVSRETVHQSWWQLAVDAQLFSGWFYMKAWWCSGRCLKIKPETKNFLRTLTDRNLQNQTLLPLFCIKFLFLFYRESLKAAQQALSVTEFMEDLSGKPPLMLTSALLSNTETVKHRASVSSQGSSPARWNNVETYVY